MLDHEKTKEELIEELQELRRSVRRLEYKSREDACQSIENSSLILLKMLDRSNQAYLLLQDGKLEFLNQACVEMFGYSQGECSSLPHMLEKVIHPDDREMVNKYYSYRLRSDTANHRYACRIFCKDGSAKWLDIQSAGLVWNDKLTFLIVATDITQYMQIQSSLQETASTLEERVKELNCLYQIANVVRKPGLSLPGILEKAVNLVRTAWKDTVVLCVMIRAGDDIYKTPNYVPCARKQTEAIEVDGAAVGLIEVGYFEEQPESLEGSALNGKRSMIKAISEMLGETISSKRLFEKMKILQKAIKTSINGIGFADADGKAFAVNDSLLSMWGFRSEDEVIGKHISEFMESPKTTLELIEKLKKGPVVVEQKARRKDGTTFDAQLSVSSVNDDSGNLLCMMGSFLDVSERKLVERDIREREQQFRAITDSTFDAIVMINDVGKILVWNPAAERMFGYRLSEAMGKDVHNLLAPTRFQPDAFSNFNEFTLSGKGNAVGKVVELAAVRKNGKEFPIELTLSSFQIDGRWHASAVVRDITHRKEAEEKLKVSENRFRTFIESSPDAIFVQIGGKFAYVNKSAMDLFGADSVDSLLGCPVMRYFHPNDVEAVKERIHLLNIEKKPVPPKEEKYIRQDGSIVPVEVSAVPMRYEGEDGALVFARDLTERNKLYQALRSSEERFRQVSANAEEWIWEVDQDGMYTYSSSAVQKILGYSIDEVVGKKYFYDFFLPEEREKLKELAFSEFAEKRSFSQFINRNVRKDGAIVTIESSGVAIFDQQGEMIGYRGVDKDITEQVRAEAERLRLVTAIEQTAATVLITGVDGTIEYVNPAFERITGYTSGEVVGKNPRILQSGKHDRAFYLDLWKTISGGKVWTGRLINKTKDGALVYKDGSIAPVRGSDGNIVNYVQVTQDVTKEVELQNQLVQAQKLEAIGTLAGGIAHDFNNILFAITGFTELAMMDLPADSRARSNMERVMQAAKRSGDMVKQILAFSRRGYGEVLSLDLTPLVKEGLKFLRGAIPSTIELRQSIEPNLDKILGDATKIHQVLMNLCINASHAIKDAKGTIAVELSQMGLGPDFTEKNPPLVPGKYVRLRVSDTGSGIAPEIMEKIFDPYFTTKEAGKGTGLGLSVVRDIVRSHHGTITLNSEVGKGSTFDVFFPVIEEQGPQVDEKPVADVIPVGKERILVVDDENHLLEMYERQLKRLGYEATCTANPEAALELFRADPQKFDLVITDFTMPKMTGIELANELSSIRPGFPIILCSGVSQVVSDSETKKAGIQAVIYKPIRRQEIAQAIRKALDQKT